MRALDLIQLLQTLVTEYGDLSIEDEYGKTLDGVDFNDDDGECFLISY
jgi:hypothetical protein